MKIGKEISLAANYVKVSPAVPVYKDDDNDIFAVIYYIEIGITDDEREKDQKYLIIDYRTYDLSETDRDELYKIALDYCKKNKIELDDSIEIKFLETEQASIFIEKIFNSMKTVRGLVR